MKLARFKLRTLMIAVAIVAALMGLVIEYRRLNRDAAKYRAWASEHAAIGQTLRWIIERDGADAPIDISPRPGVRSKRFTAKAVAEREASLRLKYERAARYPWLPVPPDPSEPE
jgi:hypothetical protein